MVRPSVAAKGALGNQECNAKQTAARHVGYVLRGILFPWNRLDTTKPLNFGKVDCVGYKGRGVGVGRSCNTEHASCGQEISGR